MARGRRSDRRGRDASDRLPGSRGDRRAAPPCVHNPGHGRGPPRVQHSRAARIHLGSRPRQQLRARHSDSRGRSVDGRHASSQYGHRAG